MSSTSSNVLNDLAVATNGLVSAGFGGAEIISAIQNICE